LPKCTTACGKAGVARLNNWRRIWIMFNNARGLQKGRT
jgi:hypothetical protein